MADSTTSWTPPAADAVSTAPVATWTPPAADAVGGQSGWKPPAADAPVSTNPIDAFRNSAGSLISGVGHLGTQIDQGIQAHAPAWLSKTLGATGDLQNGGDQSVVNAGADVSGPNQYQPAPVHQLGSDLASGHPLSALNDAAGVVAGAAPYAVAAIPGVGPAIVGGSAAGNTIDTREQAQGESSPSAGDVAAGVGSGIVNTLGGGRAHGVMGPIAGKLTGSLAARLAARTAIASGAGATVGAANQALDTAGTPGGVSGVGSAAIEGAGTGAIAAPAAEAPKATSEAVSSNRAAVVANAQAKIDPTILQSRANVADMIRQAQANDGGVPLTHTQAANNVVQSLNTQLNSAARALAVDPSLTQGQREGVKTIFPALSNQALSAKNSLGVDAAGNADGSAASALNQFHQLGIDPAKTAALTEGLRDLDTLSQNKFLKQTSGPLATIGGKIGAAIPATAAGLIGMEHGLPEAALGGIVPGVPAIGGKIGTAIGAAGDRALGNATPPVLKQGDAAAAYLQSIGVPRSPLSLTTLQNANNARFQAPDPATTAPPTQAEIAKANFDKMVQQARIKQAAQTNAQMVKDQASQAKSKTAQRGADVQSAFALSPEEAMKAKLVNTANTTMATEGLPVTGNSVPIAQYVENTLQKRRDAIDPPQDSQDDSPVPSKAPAASPVAPAPAQPSAGNVETPAPQTAVASGDRRQTLGDYLSHLAIASPGGTELTLPGISAGIDSAAASGDLTPAQATFYKGHLGAPMDNSGGMHNANLNTILAHSVALQPDSSASPTLPTGPKGAGGTPNGGPRPVANAYQAKMAAAGYHADAGNSAKIAASANNLPLAAKIMEIAGTPEVAQKQALASEFIGAENDPIKKAQAQLFLKGRLLTQGKK